MPEGRLAMPKISICSSTYNHEKYVEEAINSVLRQSLQDFELILTDDCSTDDNVEKIKTFDDPRIRLFCHETNRGNMVASANCYKYSSGQYIAWLTTDDAYEPNMLAVLSTYLDNNPHVLGVFAQAIYVDEDGKPLDYTFGSDGIGQDRYTHLRNLFKVNNYFCCPTAMIRRSTFDMLGYFPLHLRQIHDMAYWILALFHGELAILPDKVLRFRMRANNANAGSDTPENRRRVNFEVYKNLRLYAQYIDNVDLLCKVFPEVKHHPWPLEQRLVRFHLAHVALAQPTAIHRLFGLDLLYQLMENADEAEYLRQVCRFDYPDLFALEGQKPLFADYGELSQTEAQHIDKINLLTQMLSDSQAHRQILEDRQKELLASASWKMTSLLRRVGSALKG